MILIMFYSRMFIISTKFILQYLYLFSFHLFTYWTRTFFFKFAICLYQDRDNIDIHIHHRIHLFVWWVFFGIWSSWIIYLFICDDRCSIIDSISPLRYCIIYIYSFKIQYNIVKLPFFSSIDGLTHCLRPYLFFLHVQHKKCLVSMTRVYNRLDMQKS